jgi:hypothetical protein
VQRLSALVGTLRGRAHTVGDVIDATDQAGFGFLAAFLALVALPIPPLSMPFGLAVTLLGLQLLAGRSEPWLPRRLRARPIGDETLGRLEERVRRLATRFERLARPRYERLTSGPGLRAVGLALVLQGIALALPMPFPAGNLIFAAPIILYGLGLLESDGVLVGVGHVLTAATMVAMVVFFWQIVGLVERAVGWIVRLWA